MFISKIRKHSDGGYLVTDSAGRQRYYDPQRLETLSVADALDWEEPAALRCPQLMDECCRFIDQHLTESANA